MELKLTISDVSELRAFSTVGLWRSRSERVVCSGDEWPENVPISPLELDSVKLGVPSVQVGVDPSTEAGGVHASAPLDP